MNYKLISKNSFGVVILLLVVVLLSQSRFFDFMINTSLGRFFLIAIILIVSCIHKILGVVSVLLIIIIFNNMDFPYLEGMTSNLNDNDTSSGSASDSASNSSSSAIPPTMDDSSKSESFHNNTEKKKSTKSLEGFDMIGKERQLQKGRSSNTIPVNDYMKESKNLEPHDWSSFSEIFSPF